MHLLILSLLETESIPGYTLNVLKLKVKKINENSYFISFIKTTPGYCSQFQIAIFSIIFYTLIQQKFVKPLLC